MAKYVSDDVLNAVAFAHAERPHESNADCIKQSPCAGGSRLKYSRVPMHYPMPPSALEVTRESTLSWFIRALNGLEPKEGRELLRQILGTSD
jgi:hypothetical protein